MGSQGYQAAHVFEIGLEGRDDGPIWEHAQKSNAVIVSKDEDFVDRWLLSEKPVPGLDSQRELLKQGAAGVA